MISLIIPFTSGWWGEKVGERLRGVQGGEWMWERRDLFSEVNSLPG